jgi:hypothetical protein
MDCMMKWPVIVIGILAAFCFQTAPVAMEQGRPANNMQTLYEKVTADKRLVVATNMELSEAEAKGFWPLYEAYQKDLQGLTDRLRRLTEEYTRQYGAISDDSARKLLEDYVLIERHRQKFREYYLSKFRQVLPEKKVIRYYQLENKILALVNYDLAARIPFIE